MFHENNLFAIHFVLTIQDFYAANLSVWKIHPPMAGIIVAMERRERKESENNQPQT